MVMLKYQRVITHMLVWFLFASLVIQGYPLMSSEAQKTEVGPADAKALAFSGKNDTIWSWQLGKMMIHYVMMGHSIFGDKPRCKSLTISVGLYIHIGRWEESIHFCIKEW